MSERTAPRPGLPTHPIQRTARRLLVLGGIYLLAGLAAAVLFGGVNLPSGLAALFGAVLLLAGVRQRRIGPAVMLNNAAHDLLTQGRYDEAIAMLDTIPAAQRTGLVGMAILSQRAYVRFAQGDAAAAVALSAEALALPMPLVGRAQGRQYKLSLRANRSMMLAAAGDLDAARDEADRVDLDPEAQPALRGATSLARAVIHARREDREALVAELARSQPWLEQLGGREAALVRTLRRYVASPSGGAYRAPAARDAADSPEARWIATVVPQAAAFAPRAAERREPADVTRLPEASPAAHAKVLADRARAAKRAPNPVVLRVVVWVGAMIALAVGPSWLGLPYATALLPWTIGAVLALLIALTYARNRRVDRWVRFARELAAKGRVDNAEALLERAARAPSHLHAAVALLDEAELAERRNDLPAALERVDRALGRLAKNAAVKAAASDILLPGLIALRARVLAAMDRADEALAELAVLSREHPTFPYATGATLAVRVVLALRLGDRPLARALVRSRTTDVRLPHHVRLLFDLIAGEDGWYEADGEPERIASELASHPGAHAWIERVATGLTPAPRLTSVRIATDDAAVGDEADAAIADARPAKATSGG